MSIYQSKITREFRDNMCELSPIAGRKYTITHSDETGQIFVTIGCSYAEDKFGPSRDEVLLSLECINGCWQFFGIVHLDPPNDRIDISTRRDIFLREMHVALEAVRHVDKTLFSCYPCLDYSTITIQFQSKNPDYHKSYSFGKIGDYRMPSF